MAIQAEEFDALSARRDELDAQIDVLQIERRDISTQMEEIVEARRFDYFKMVQWEPLKVIPELVENLKQRNWKPSDIGLLTDSGTIYLRSIYQHGELVASVASNPSRAAKVAIDIPMRIIQAMKAANETKSEVGQGGQ